MKRKNHQGWFATGLGVVALAISALAFPLPAAGDNLSHVRIVRLSFTEGTVTLKRPGLADWAIAPVNTPIQEGFKLSTAEQGFAEVEFENTSTARLGQLSVLDFDQLAATDTGDQVNRMTLEQGYATLNVVPDGIQTFEVKAQGAAVTLSATRPTEFRVDIDEGIVRVEVFKGAAEVSSPDGQTTLTGEKVLEIRPGSDQPFEISNGITTDAWDQWVDQRQNQETSAGNAPSPQTYSSGSGSYYGWNDLSNYGEWNDFGGYGYGWVPQVGFGWSPYSTGRWCWYPGVGFTWISNEPWGWLPFHCGSWLFQPGIGWTWFPGSLGNWSPGNVNWIQGSGWVGWSPQGPTGRRPVNCGGGQNCGRIIVRPDVIREGKPVIPSRRIEANASEGTNVAKPDVLPTQDGMLTGRVVIPRWVVTSKSDTASARTPSTGMQLTSGRNTVVIGDSGGGSESRKIDNTSKVHIDAPAESGIAFDAKTGSYLNSNRTKSVGTISQPAPGLAGQEEAAQSTRRSGNSRVAAPGNFSSFAMPQTAAPADADPSVGTHQVETPTNQHARSGQTAPRPSASASSSGSQSWGRGRSSAPIGGNYSAPATRSSPSSYRGGGSGGRAASSIGSSGGGSRNSGGSSSGGGGGGSHSSASTSSNGHSH